MKKKGVHRFEKVHGASEAFTVLSRGRNLTLFWLIFANYLITLWDLCIDVKS